MSWEWDFDTPTRWAVLRHRLYRWVTSALATSGIIGWVAFVTTTVVLAGSEPVVVEKKVYLAPIESSPSAQASAVAVRETPPTVRVVLVGDSSLSLWQDALAQAIMGRGVWRDRPISAVLPLAEEGKLPCYFKPALKPNDIVIYSFVVSGWHRTEGPECNPSGPFLEYRKKFLLAVKEAGAVAIPLALPSGAPGAVSFTGEPWFEGLSPDELESSAAVGGACIDGTITGPDKFHVAPEGIGPLVECLLKEMK